MLVVVLAENITRVGSHLKVNEYGSKSYLRIRCWNIGYHETEIHDAHPLEIEIESNKTIKTKPLS